MTTATIFGDTTDGQITSGANATYLTARTGTGLVADTSSANASAGQQKVTPGFVCLEGFFSWDTSTLGSAAIVSVCTASLWLNADNSTNDFVSRMRLDSWGTLTTADWIAGETFPSTFTLLAHLDSNGIGATGAYKAFVDDAFAVNVNRTGSTQIVVTSDRFEAGTSPGSTNVNEYLQWVTADQAGTTNDPKLDITYTLASSAKSPMIGQAVNRAAVI